MWIIVQIIICVSLISIAIVLPKGLYSFLLFLGIIFTLFAVFANWLLIVQIFNIVISGGMGIKIIESRDILFGKIYRKVMRADKEFNRLIVTADSKVNIIVVVCTLIVILLSFWSFSYNYGGFNSFFVSPLRWFRYYDFANIGKCIDLLGSVLMLYYSWTYTAQKVEVFIIPAILRVVTLLIYEVYYGITQGYWEYILTNWFVALTFLVIFMVIILFVNNILKSKFIAVAACVVPVMAALILCLFHKPPFANPSGFIAVSYLVSFIAYCMGYAVLISSFRRSN